MRLYSAQITRNSRLWEGAHLLEMHVPPLAQAIQPGQYCMVRCCHPLASDPLLRRPFFIHSTDRDHGICTLLVQARGRGSSWLAEQPVGMTLDLLAPLGHGWDVRPTAGNLLLLCEVPLIPALTLLAQTALAQERAVTLLARFAHAESAYPPALLPPEVEYQVITDNDRRGDLVAAAGEYLPWADAAFCAVFPETAASLYNRYEKMRAKRFAQGVLLHLIGNRDAGQFPPFACAAGVCLTCAFPTSRGPKLICRDGPVFDLRDIARNS